MKEFRRRDLLKTSAAALAAAGLGGLSLRAQSGDSFVGDFGADWKLKKANAVEMAEAMPAEKYDFKPTPEMRPFGQLMVHLAQSCYFFAAGATGVDMPADSRFEGEATKDRVIPYMRKAFEFAGQAVAGVDDAKAAEIVPIFGSLRGTRRKVCEFMRDHVTHHLGYSVPYLRLSGVTKVPAYRFTGGNQSPV